MRVRLVGISVDEAQPTHALWEKLGGKFQLLSDPGGSVIRRYGVLHAGGGETDIALDTTLLVDERGVERWRRVSRTLPDLLSAADTLVQIRQSLGHASPANK